MEHTPVSRKLFLTLGAAVAAWTTLGATQALAHYPYRPCVWADHGARLYPEHPFFCDEGRRCGLRVHGAFRVKAQDGDLLLVRRPNGWGEEGWIDIRSVRIAPSWLCRRHY